MLTRVGRLSDAVARRLRLYVAAAVFTLVTGGFDIATAELDVAAALLRLDIAAAALRGRQVVDFFPQAERVLGRVRLFLEPIRHVRSSRRNISSSKRSYRTHRVIHKADPDLLANSSEGNCQTGAMPEPLVVAVAGLTAAG